MTLHRRPRVRAVPLSLLALACALPAAAQTASPVDAPYAPGTITLAVDASDLSQRIFKVRETIPVAAGALTLLQAAKLNGPFAVLILFALPLVGDSE